ncbi:hypothetical protein NLM33_36675 [Bradyrhizobium sp. CCGUVB1N3]|uniref:hypothetical protein n=1 Tax=Bradyrhizobium sp. CCGUVB1N3 TaxID=2949629 RepID=UPI0020B1B2BF|nr:hypothetical protein [Bradyrhizobium sp. CCGUVB1N3]MCP3475788.1 hypothetical protein [Bradyrhizobium sp. CCGUVB1N3]
MENRWSPPVDTRLALAGMPSGCVHGADHREPPHSDHAHDAASAKRICRKTRLKWLRLMQVNSYLATTSNGSGSAGFTYSQSAES